MILRTKIDWLQAKELSEKEKAKKEVLGADYVAPKEEFEKTQKDAIVDTYTDKLYIGVSENKVCIMRLLDTQFIPNTEGGIEKFEDTILIEGTIENIYNQLTESLLKTK